MGSRIYSRNKSGILALVPLTISPICRHVCQVALLQLGFSSSILVLAASIYFYTVKSSGKESIFSLLLRTRVNIISVFIILPDFKWQRQILPFTLLPVAVNKHKQQELGSPVIWQAQHRTTSTKHYLSNHHAMWGREACRHLSLKLHDSSMP